MIPELDCSHWFTRGEEVFFRAKNDIKNIVSQGIPSSLALELPGANTELVICFPCPCVTRVYTLHRSFHGPFHRPHFYFAGECDEGYGIYKAAKRVTYRYGMRLPPWMPLGGFVKHDEKQIVNYVVENCTSGFSGVLIRLCDMPCSQRKEEWLEIHQFNLGNDGQFEKGWPQNSKLIVRCVPVNVNTVRLGWQPEKSWESFKKLRRIPAKLSWA